MGIGNGVCPRCGERRFKTGEDACLGKLPGVWSACCGHGIGEGHICFISGVTLHGFFQVEYKPKNLRKASDWNPPKNFLRSFLPKERKNL